MADARVLQAEADVRSFFARHMFDPAGDTANAQITAVHANPAGFLDSYIPPLRDLASLLLAAPAPAPPPPGPPAPQPPQPLVAAGPIRRNANDPRFKPLGGELYPSAPTEHKLSHVCIDPTLAHGPPRG